MSLKTDETVKFSTGVPINELPARVVIVERIYHAIPGRNPTSIQQGFSRKIICKEQPYTREMKLTEEWRPLDKGWIEEIGLVLISVAAGDPEVQVGVLIREYKDSGVDIIQRFSRVPPGESIRLSPFQDELFLRKAMGDSKKEAIALVWAFPV